MSPCDFPLQSIELGRIQISNVGAPGSGESRRLPSSNRFPSFVLLLRGHRRAAVGGGKHCHAPALTCKEFVSGVGSCVILTLPCSTAALDRTGPICSRRFHFEAALSPHQSSWLTCSRCSRFHVYVRFRPDRFPVSVLLHSYTLTLRSTESYADQNWPKLEEIAFADNRGWLPARL